jgi:hypothetical protein
MGAGNRHEINAALKLYKTDSGAANFPALFEIKTENRLPALYEKEPAKIAAIVTTGLTLAMETMNLNRSMNASQIMDLADTILDSSKEDNLALEDLMLFMQKLVRGEYGKLYESMDIPKFMELFEIYREERFQAMKNLREEQAAQHSALPINDRLSTDDRRQHREALIYYLKNKKDV